MRDLDGRVGEVQFDLVFAELLAALDNTPEGGGRVRRRARAAGAPGRRGALPGRRLIVLAAHPARGGGERHLGNVGPASPLGSAAAASPGATRSTNYSLDQHFDAVEASLTGGVDVSGVPPMIAYFLASILWLGDELPGEPADHPLQLRLQPRPRQRLAGRPAAPGRWRRSPSAIHSIYSDVFGAPWLVLAIAVAGIWAMWKALVQRRYSETAGALGALADLRRRSPCSSSPSRARRSAAPRSGRTRCRGRSSRSPPTATLRAARQAKEDAANQLFDLLVFKPWVVLNFGGLEHCVVAGTGDEDSDPESVAVRPLSSEPQPRRRARPPAAARDRGHRRRQGLRQQREQVRAALPALRPRRTERMNATTSTTR